MEAREKLRKLRESTGMNRKELRLMAYKVEMERLSDKRFRDDKEDNIASK